MQIVKFIYMYSVCDKKGYIQWNLPIKVTHWTGQKRL